MIRQLEFDLIEITEHLGFDIFEMIRQVKLDLIHLLVFDLIKPIEFDTSKTIRQLENYQKAHI